MNEENLRNVPLYNEKCTYVTTIVAEGKNLKGLEEVLASNEKSLTGEEPIRYGPGRVYWKVKEDLRHEFDVYEWLRSKRTQDTEHFRDRLGRLLSILIQKGFKVSAKKLPISQTIEDGDVF